MWEKTKKKETQKVWLSFKNPLHCKSEPSQVHDPRREKHLTKKTGRSGCSRSIANLKDVIHGSKRHLQRPPAASSPRSIGSSDFLNPITHQVIFTDSKCELKITGFGAFHEDFSCSDADDNAGSGGTFFGTLRPGTPGPGDRNSLHCLNNSATTRKNSYSNSDLNSSSKSHVSLRQKRAPLERDEMNGGAATCHKCGEQFVKWEALEFHHLSTHAPVTELVEGDSSRKIVEIICRSSWSKPEARSVRIERIMKVHNMQKALARFEDYREAVKIRASKLPKKHPRCLADGNELLRFFATYLTCSLGIGSSSLCASDKCNVCRIIRNGFSTERDEAKGGVGVFTASTSGRALESIETNVDDPTVRKALIVCRVIAGRVHRPLENVHEIIGQTGFDSLAGKVGLYSDVEELYLLSPKALLPCFVVVCKS